VVVVARFGLLWFGLVWVGEFGVMLGLVGLNQFAGCMIVEPRNGSPCTFSRTARVIHKVLYTSTKFRASPQRFSY
jgi:hypothetical protein